MRRDYQAIGILMSVAAHNRAAMRGIMDSMIRAEWMKLLRAASGHRCGICGGRLHGRPNIDHVLPLSAGGADSLGNVVPSHEGCNADKANDMPTGCELVWLLSINAIIGVQPDRWQYPA